MVHLYKGRCLHNYMDVPETSVSILVHLSGFKKFVLNYFNEIFDTVLALECHLLKLLVTLHKMVPQCCKIWEIWNMYYNMV